MWYLGRFVTHYIYLSSQGKRWWREIYTSSKRKNILNTRKNLNTIIKTCVNIVQLYGASLRANNLCVLRWLNVFTQHFYRHQCVKYILWKQWVEFQVSHSALFVYVRAGGERSLVTSFQSLISPVRSVSTAWQYRGHGYKQKTYRS